MNFTNKIKTGTVCSGIGSPEVAIEELAKEEGFVIENAFACDVDKHAKASYLANFTPKDFFEDMTSDFFHAFACHVDLFIGGIPCQAFSLAGKRLGELDKRGLLFYDFYEYVRAKQPKVFIIENVKGLLSDNKGITFQNWLSLLGRSVNQHEQMFLHPDSLEYNLHYTVLNSKDFGVPQNRERVFIVGVRKDLPNTFRFPKGFRLTKRLIDVLEKVVDEKYYLSEKAIAGFTKHRERHEEAGNGFKFQPKLSDEIANTVSTKNSRNTDTYIAEPVFVSKEARTEEAKAERRKTGTNSFRGKEIIFEPSETVNTITTSLTNDHMILEPLCGAARGRPSEDGIQQQLEINETGTTNCLTSVQKDNYILEPLILGYTRDEKGNITSRHAKDIANTVHTKTGGGGSTDQYVLEDISLKQVGSLYDNNADAGRIYDAEGLARTIKAEGGGGGAKTGLYLIKGKPYRVRKLTPLETWRLQGFPDENFMKAAKVCSETQLYKQAGNSMTTKVMKGIIKNCLPILFTNDRV